LKKVKTAVHQFSTKTVNHQSTSTIISYAKKLTRELANLACRTSVCSLHYDLFGLNKVSIVLHKDQLFLIIREKSCLTLSDDSWQRILWAN